ncbi:MAG TPA: hypothetical protein VGR53_05350 [Nitrososphaerales archaeon]|nr:hypothetical protein [Nitrososphaerales archaeon]
MGDSKAEKLYGETQTYLQKKYDDHMKATKEALEAVRNWDKKNIIDPRWLLLELASTHSELAYLFGLEKLDHEVTSDFLRWRDSQGEGVANIEMTRQELKELFDKNTPAFKWFERFEKHRPKTEGDSE